MTDKQIINGVSVGWCMNYNAANSKDCETLYICAENPNCYYKQLKRKEQECERLKETFDDLFKVQYKLADNNKKLRQCLTEIKNKLTVHKTLYYESKLIEKLHKQILQKISECDE